MAEAIISRRGYGTEGRPKPQTLRTIYKISTEEFQVPNAINNSFHVRIFGGGGGGGYRSNVTYTSTHIFYGAGGGGGWMNNDTIDLTGYDSIPITIGTGGNAGSNYHQPGNAGGTTSFGVFLSANGGSGGNASGGDGGNGGSGGGGAIR